MLWYGVRQRFWITKSHLLQTLLSRCKCVWIARLVSKEQVAHTLVVFKTQSRFADDQRRPRSADAVVHVRRQGD